MIRDEKTKIDEMFAQMTEIVQNTSFVTDRQRILKLPYTLFKVWKSGYAGVANEILQHKGVKYFTVKKPNAQQALIEPNSPDAIEIYRPFTDIDDKEWIFGEYIENGWIRYDNGVAYQAYGITDPLNVFMNRVKPSLAPANWKKVN